MPHCIPKFTQTEPFSKRSFRRFFKTNAAQAVRAHLCTVDGGDPQLELRTHARPPAEPLFLHQNTETFQIATF